MKPGHPRASCLGVQMKGCAQTVFEAVGGGEFTEGYRSACLLSPHRDLQPAPSSMGATGHMW